MGEEKHIFMKANKIENILIKFWTLIMGVFWDNLKKNASYFFNAMFGLGVR
jgi:hypothetical protein